MVDAIGAVNTQQIKPPKKDNSINWKQCTSEEIIEHEKEGQEIPDYILQWAKEFAKLQNAPEDITYEMAMGATTMAGVNANQNGNQDNKTDNDEEGPNTAEAIRQKLAQEGVSTYTQAKTFRTYSDQYTNEIQSLMDSMETYLAESAAAADEAAQAKDDVMSRIQALIASKKQTKQGDLSSAVEAARIDREIRAVGQSGLSIIENTAAPIESTEGNITAAEFTSLTGRQFGNTAVSIGQELMTESSYFALPKLVMGKRTVKSGEDEIKKSNEGDNQFSDNLSENGEYNKSILANKDEVRRASGASIGNTDETKDTDKKADENKTVNNADNEQIANESNTKKEELAAQDPDTIDEKITTDPNEILKRKQKRGLA